MRPAKRPRRWEGAEERPQDQRFNDGMHPRSPFFLNAPSFAAIQERDEDFAALCTQTPGRGPGGPGSRPKTTIDFRDAKAVAAATRCILEQDFGVPHKAWSMPETKLVPVIPGRLNYVLWAQDLWRAVLPEACAWTGTLALWHTAHSVADRRSAAFPPLADIGTGASAVYSLLAARHLGVRVVATELEPTSLEQALGNVERCGCGSGLVRVVGTPSSAEFLAPALRAAGWVRARGSASAAGEADSAPASDPAASVSAAVACAAADAAAVAPGASPAGRGMRPLRAPPLSVVLCNPPFFETGEEANSNSRTADVGASAELVFSGEGSSETAVPGGDEGFVAAMVSESASLTAAGGVAATASSSAETEGAAEGAGPAGRASPAALWHTSLLGRKASLEPSRARAVAAGATMAVTVTLRQGRTLRWALAWTFLPAICFAPPGATACGADAARPPRFAGSLAMLAPGEAAQRLREWSRCNERVGGAAACSGGRPASGGVWTRGQALPARSVGGWDVVALGLSRDGTQAGAAAALSRCLALTTPDHGSIAAGKAARIGAEAAPPQAVLPTMLAPRQQGPTSCDAAAPNQAAAPTECAETGAAASSAAAQPGADGADELKAAGGQPTGRDNGHSGRIRWTLPRLAGAAAGQSHFAVLVLAAPGSGESAAALPVDAHRCCCVSVELRPRLPSSASSPAAGGSEVVVACRSAQPASRLVGGALLGRALVRAVGAEVVAACEAAQDRVETPTG